MDDVTLIFNCWLDRSFKRLPEFRPYIQALLQVQGELARYRENVITCLTMMTYESWGRGSPEINAHISQLTEAPSELDEAYDETYQDCKRLHFTVTPGKWDFLYDRMKLQDACTRKVAAETATDFWKRSRCYRR